MRFFVSLLSVAVLALVTLTQGDGVPEAKGTIRDFLEQSSEYEVAPKFTILLQLLDLAAEAEPESDFAHLDDPEQSYVFFALPDNVLVAKGTQGWIPPNDWTEMNSLQSVNLLSLLFVPEFPQDVEDRPIQMRYGLDWLLAHIEFYDDFILMNHQLVALEPSIELANGIVYVMDDWDRYSPEDLVRLPTVADLITSVTKRSTPELTMIQQALEAADLLDILDDPEILTTLYVPTDEAFDKWLQSHDLTFEELLSDENFLTELLLYHMVDFVTPAYGAIQDIYPTRLGHCIYHVHYTSASEISNGVEGDTPARFLWHDILASNGAIHVVDGLLSVPKGARTCEIPPPYDE
jgi:uncharacterized surface protein with fasciclin (FAS1) repeats